MKCECGNKEKFIIHRITDEEYDAEYKNGIYVVDTSSRSIDGAIDENIWKCAKCGMKLEEPQDDDVEWV